MNLEGVVIGLVLADEMTKIPYGSMQEIDHLSLIQSYDDVGGIIRCVLERG